MHLVLTHSRNSRFHGPRMTTVWVFQQNVRMCYVSEILEFMQFMKTGRLVVAVVVLNVREWYANPFFETPSHLRLSENMRIWDSGEIFESQISTILESRISWCSGSIGVSNTERQDTQQTQQTQKHESTKIQKHETNQHRDKETPKHRNRETPK
jgi:hypothetical protein